MIFFSQIEPKLVDTEIFDKLKKNNQLKTENDLVIPNIIKNNIFKILIILFVFLFLFYRYQYTLSKKETNKLINNQLIEIFQKELIDQEYQLQKNKQIIESLNKEISQKQKNDNDAFYKYMERSNFF